MFSSRCTSRAQTQQQKCNRKDCVSLDFSHEFHYLTYASIKVNGKNNFLILQSTCFSYYSSRFESIIIKNNIQKYSLNTQKRLFEWHVNKL